MAGYIGSKGSGIISGIGASIADLNLTDKALANGTTEANKVLTADGNKDVTAIRNLTATGTVTAPGLTLDTTAVTATGTEINQLSAITRGSILYGDASGATARLAAGGVSTVLTSDGTDLSWAAPAAGGAYNLLQTVTASGSDSDISIGTSSLITTAYSVYEIHVIGLIPTSGSQTIRGRVLIGENIISTSNYDFFSFDTHSGSSTGSGMVNAQGQTYFSVVQNVNNAASGVANFVLRFYNPTSTTLTKTWDYSGSAKDANLARIRFISGGAGYNNGTAALSGFNFFPAGGNITSGVLKLYGIT